MRTIGGQLGRLDDKARSPCGSTAVVGMQSCRHELKLIATSRPHGPADLPATAYSATIVRRVDAKSAQ